MLQSIEINYFIYEDMFCMFCGEQVLFEDNPPAACPHVLFIASSEGYDYESPLVAAILPSFDVEDEQESEKSFLNRLREVNKLPNDSFVIESYSTLRDSVEVYVGFSPSTS